MKEGGTAEQLSRQSCDGSMFHAELIVSKEEGTNACTLRGERCDVIFLKYSSGTIVETGK